MIEVVVDYDASQWPQFDSAIEAAVGRHSNYSGMGFGRRDHGWVCNSEIEAERIKRSLRKIGLSPTIRSSERAESGALGGFEWS